MNEEHIRDIKVRIEAIVRLARWLKLDVGQKNDETDAQYRWRIGRSILREQKKLQRQPKK